MGVRAPLPAIDRPTKRRISHSEASTLLDCQFKHAFAYTGRLTGDALKPKSTAPQLREGAAWGAAVAAWHANFDKDPSEAHAHAMAAMEIRLSLDAARQQEHGTYDPDEHTRLATHLHTMLQDYVAHAEPIALTRPEHKLEVAIPSRTGKRASNRYVLEAFVDGVHTDSAGRDWIVEFKLRKQLQPFELIARDRQVRWYAWAWREVTGRPVAGVIVDQRLNAEPAELRLNKNGAPSKVQSCRPDVYEQTDEPDAEVLAKLRAKEWERRDPLILTDAELEEAGRQLASVGSLIHQLDAGQLYPIRNPSPMRCPGCAFRDICVSPGDTELVDALYERRPAKRERKEEDATAVR